MSNNDLATAQWFKSSRSNGQNNCVEVTFLGDRTVAARDSKNSTGPALAFPGAQWRTWIDSMTSETE